MGQVWFGAGCVLGFLAVVMAAVGAHAVSDPAAAQSVRSAVQMQGWHAIMLVICGVWRGRGGVPADVAGAAFLLGSVLFCGSVYAGVFAGWRTSLAPVGGVVLMAGWIALAVSARAA